ARANLMTSQLVRVAAVYERDPAQGYELLHDYNACPIDLRDFAWGWYAYQCRRRDYLVLNHQSAVHAVALSRDGQVLASGGGGVLTRAVFPVSVVGLLGSVQGQGPLLAASALYRNRPETVALGEVRLWEVATRQQRATLRHTGFVTSVAFSS